MANIGIQYYLLLCNHSALHCADMCTYDINKLWSKHGKGFKPKRSFLMQASFGAWRMHVFICNRFSVSFQVLCTKLLDILLQKVHYMDPLAQYVFLKAVSRWKSYLFYKEDFLCGVSHILPFQEQHSNQLSAGFSPQLQHTWATWVDSSKDQMAWEWGDPDIHAGDESCAACLACGDSTSQTRPLWQSQSLERLQTGKRFRAFKHNCAQDLLDLHGSMLGTSPSNRIHKCFANYRT